MAASVYLRVLCELMAMVHIEGADFKAVTASRGFQILECFRF